MATNPTEWNVLPHDPLTPLADNLWRVEGELPGMALRRCMVVARLASGDLVIHNGMALDEAGMAELEALGRPAWLVVPNGWHRLDAARYKARYPDIQILCPRGSRARIEKVVAVDQTYDRCPCPGDDDETVKLEHLEGIRGAEGVMSVRSADGITLIFNDAIFNLEHGRGLFWLIYGRLLGNAGGPKVTTITRLFMVKQKHELRASLTRLAAVDDLRRIIVAHGAVIDTAPAEVLQRLAGQL